jgi:Fur family ferric uptake transcriptional regulator
LRVTAPRLATLQVIAERQHADAEEIASAVRDHLGTVSKQAVYDVLRALTDAGLVRRVAPGNGGARYEVHRHDNHHHMVCTECGRIEDVPCLVGQAPCLTPEDDLGFEIEIAEVLFRGVCSRCRTAAPSGDIR